MAGVTGGPPGKGAVAAPSAQGASERRAPRPLIEIGIPAVFVGLMLLTMPLYIASWATSLLGRMMILGLFAMSLNLIWGHTGMPSFGHAAFFGAGGYTVALLTVRGGVTSFWLNLLLALVVTATVAAILGFPAFRVFGVGAGNANPIYFLLTTLAFGEILSRVAIAARKYTLGTNGLPGIPEPDLGLGFRMNAFRSYYLTFVVTAVCIFLMYRLANSRYGYVLRGIHDNERRLQALGYNTWLYKYTAWIIAGAFGGVAGVLFAYHDHIMTPTHLAMATSEMAFFLVILGSTSTFFGPLVAAAAFVWVEHYASDLVMARWRMIFGALMVLTVIALPQGLGVFVLKWWRRLTRGLAA